MLLEFNQRFPISFVQIIARAKLKWIEIAQIAILDFSFNVFIQSDYNLW